MKTTFCDVGCLLKDLIYLLYYYSMATKQNLSVPFQIFNSCVFNTNNLRESPIPKSQGSKK